MEYLDPGKKSRERRERMLEAMRARRRNPNRISSVGGKVVPYSHEEGMTGIASSILSGLMGRDLRNEEDLLEGQHLIKKDEEKAGRKSAIDKVMASLQENAPEDGMGPTKPANPQEALMTSVTDPYLKDDTALQKVLAAKAGAGKKDPFYTYRDITITDPNTGELITVPGKFNSRTGELEPVDTSILSPKYNKEVVGGLSGAKEKEKLDAQLEGKPKVSQALKEVDLEMDPKIVSAKKEADMRTESQVGADIDLDSTMSAAEYLKEKVSALKTHEGMSDVIGFPDILTAGGLWPGSKGATFRSMLEQVQGKTFLQAYETLKGGGQITEVEGTKAENALARLQKSQDEESFKAAADEYITEIDKLIDLAKKRAGYRTPKGDQKGAGFTREPSVGDIVDGYRFKGGNPADPSSWEMQ